MDQTRPNQSMQPTVPLHNYEVRPRSDKSGVDLCSHSVTRGTLEPQAVVNAMPGCDWKYNAITWGGGDDAMASVRCAATYPSEFRAAARRHAARARTAY